MDINCSQYRLLATSAPAKDHKPDSNHGFAQAHVIGQEGGGKLAIFHLREPSNSLDLPGVKDDLFPLFTRRKVYTLHKQILTHGRRRFSAQLDYAVPIHR